MCQRFEEWLRDKIAAEYHDPVAREQALQRMTVPELVGYLSEFLLERRV